MCTIHLQCYVLFLMDLMVFLFLFIGNLTIP